jgi:hypothetical protein
MVGQSRRSSDLLSGDPGQLGPAELEAIRVDRELAIAVGPLRRQLADRPGVIVSVVAVLHGRVIPVGGRVGSILPPVDPS